MPYRQLSLVLALVAGSAFAAPWPRFRGPNGSGIADDTTIPIKFDEKQGILWKVEIPGNGFSSPVVWGDHLFLQAASADGKERSLLCINPRDGSTRWTKTVPGGQGKHHARNSLATSTPATDGERVYTVFWDGSVISLYAFDFQGALAWQRDLGPLKTDHGAGASPQVAGGKVILMNDQIDSAKVLTFDAKTGKPGWSVDRVPYRPCYATPLVLEKPGEAAELVVVSTTGITGYDLGDGSKRWHWGWKFDAMPLRTVGSPILGQGLIFATSGDGSGLRHTVAIRPGGVGDITKSNLAWEEKRTLPYVPGLLYRNGYLYWTNDGGIAGCTVAKSGETIWTERLGGAITASPVLIDGKVYAVGENGTVYVFPAEPAFKLLAKNPLGELVRASPAVADGRLFIRGQKHLFCIGQK
jgi:outer membrane protein assembly factor BamB